MSTRGGYRPGSGRKKGAATLYSEALKAEIARLVEAEAPALIEAQIKEAKLGSTPAFRELMDRVLGKAPQAITDADGQSLTLAFDAAFKAYAAASSTEEGS